MDENRILELLTRKLSGEASDQELAELNRLLNTYPEAYYYDEALRQLWQNEILSTDNVNKSYERHRLKYNSEFTPDTISPEDTSQKSRLVKYSILSLAACLIAALVVINFDFNISGREKDSQIVASKGVRKKIILPDGTRVWLNSESSISFNPEMKERKTRLVKLSGEAFFEVTEDKQHPFILTTDKISIKVLGTAFNVKAYPNDKSAEATLLCGSIELSVNDRPQQKIMLKPSEKFALIEKKGQVANPKNRALVLAPKITMVIENIAPIEIANELYIEETSWKDNKLVFRNQSLAELAPKFERWFNVHITIKNEEIKEHRYTGAFTTENLTQALTAMKLIKNFNYKLHNNDVIIY